MIKYFVVHHFEKAFGDSPITLDMEVLDTTLFPLTGKNLETLKTKVITGIQKIPEEKRPTHVKLFRENEDGEKELVCQFFPESQN